MWGGKLWCGSFSLIFLEIRSSCLLTFGISLTRFISKLRWCRAFFFPPDALLFPRWTNVPKKVAALLLRMKTGRWCLPFRQMKLVCWRADVQTPALPAFSWKGEAKRRAAAAAAAVSNIKSGAVNICPWLMHRQTCCHCSVDLSRTLGWRRRVSLIQRQESELQFTSSTCRHQPGNKLCICNIYRASEWFLNQIFMPLGRFATVATPVTCDVCWQQNWDHCLLLLIEGDEQLKNNSGSDWNAGQTKRSETE